MAEADLRQKGVPPDEWSGRRFRWSENLSESIWASVVLEIERRGEQWVVTRIDRRREAIDAAGFESFA